MNRPDQGVRAARTLLARQQAQRGPSTASEVNAELAKPATPQDSPEYLATAARLGLPAVEAWIGRVTAAQVAEYTARHHDTAGGRHAER